MELKIKKVLNGVIGGGVAGLIAGILSFSIFNFEILYDGVCYHTCFWRNTIAFTCIAVFFGLCYGILYHRLPGKISLLKSMMLAIIGFPVLLIVGGVCIGMFKYKSWFLFAWSSNAVLVISAICLYYGFIHQNFSWKKRTALIIGGFVFLLPVVLALFIIVVMEAAFGVGWLFIFARSLILGSIVFIFLLGIIYDIMRELEFYLKNKKMFNKKLVALGVFTIICFTFISYVCIDNVKDGTIVNQDITKNTIWDVKGSPYIIYGRDITVEENITLRIEPGVRVVLRGVYSWCEGNVKGSLTVKGTVIAEGTKKDMIVFAFVGDKKPSTIIISNESKNSIMNYCILDNVNVTGENIIIENNHVGNPPTPFHERMIFVSLLICAISSVIYLIILRKSRVI